MIPSRRTRILIVDDSAVMRSLLRTVVTSDPEFEVAGTATDGESALRCVRDLQPDLMLLDVEMPVMDGLVTLKKLQGMGHRLPVIMCSSLTQRGARVTIEALAAGAMDYVAKPSGQAGREKATQALAQDLIPKIRALTRRPTVAATPLRWTPVAPPVIPPTQPAKNAGQPAVVLIGVSTGGPAALDKVLPAFPGTFPLPILIVQHMPELFTKLLAERLNDRCSLSVREAAEGDAVRPGTIYIARGNWHMEVHPAASASASASLHLTQGTPENHCRPAVDVLFRSAANVYGGNALAVILTGMGSDGLAGTRLLRGLGAPVLAQDQASSAVWGMPGAVATAGLTDKILPLDAIAPEILRISNRRTIEARELRESVV